MEFTSGIEWHYNIFYMIKNAKLLDNNCRLPAIILTPSFWGFFEDFSYFWIIQKDATRDVTNK